MYLPWDDVGNVGAAEALPSLDSSVPVQLRTIDGRTLEDPSWGRVECELLALTSRQAAGASVVLRTEQQARMTVRFERGRGYHVVALEAADESARVLVDSADDADVVAMAAGGRSEQLPAFLFVSEPLAFRVVRRFVATGRRSARSHWCDPVRIGS